MTARTGAAVVVAAWMLASFALRAQQTQTPQFRSGVNVIQVDARVVDAEGRPVRGLTASEFTVLEDGKARRLAAFSEIAIPDHPDPSTPWLREVAPDVAGNQEPEGRLLVVIIDDAMLPADPAMVAASKAIARGAVERMGPADRMSVVFTRDNRDAQDFTADRARLLRAIDRTAIGFIFTGRFRDTRHFWAASLSTLENVAAALSGVPARRKAILYISIGLPYDLTDTTLLRRWRELSQTGLGSNTPIYSYDPSGAGGLEAFFASHPLIKAHERPPNPKMFRDFLEDASASTGGRSSLLRNDDHAPRLERMFDDTASYYWLGYESAFPVGDGRFRRLEIKTTRPGTTVIARTGHFARPEKRSGKAADQAERALASPIHGGELAMQATAAPFASSAAGASVAVVAGFRHPVDHGATEHEVGLAIAAFEHGDRQRASQQQTARVRLRRNSNDGSANYEIRTRIDLKPGRYRLRIGAHNKDLQKSGSVFVDVDVPDFANQPLSLSGLVLSAAGWGTSAASSNGLGGLLPVVPTTLRQFSRGDKVAGFLRVHQAASRPAESVEISVRVTDASGRVITEHKDTLPAARFGRAGVDFEVPIPLSALDVGEYRLDVEAASSNAPVQRRQLRFKVTPPAE